MEQNNKFISKYIQYKNLCCDCRYEEALEVFNELLKQVEEEQEMLTQYVLGGILAEAAHKP